jgi:hypothetical protein
MKICILLGVLVLALLAMPAAVAAADSTTFSGTIPGGTTINVNPASISLGTIQVPHSYTGLAVTITVTSYDYVNWDLQSQDTTPGTSSPGYMTSTVPTARTLTAPFRIRDFTLSPVAYRPLGPDASTFYNGHASGTTTVNALFAQDIMTTDLAGTYTIVVTILFVPVV